MTRRVHLQARILGASLFFIVLLFMIPVSVSAHPPNIIWQKSLGGSASDEADSVQQTADGGYIVAGYTNSNNGDVTGFHGTSDYWVVKLNSTGSIEWQKALGGMVADAHANSVNQTADGGYIVAGYANNGGGDISLTHASSYDYWVVKLNSTGSIEWEKVLGGTATDYGNSVQQTTDGGYIVAGQSNSNNGDVSGNQGDYDFWVVKLNSTGGITWQKSLGGTGWDSASSVLQTSDGGYIVAGQCGSNDGDITGFHGSWDFWAVKLNSTGVITWQKALGGLNSDGASSVQQTADSVYIIAGYSYSDDANVTGHHGSTSYSDAWVVKLDSGGNLTWQKSLGGTGSDYAKSVQQMTDGGYFIAGYSNSPNDGDVSGNHGDYDYWIMKLDSSGNLAWQKSLGGTNDDTAYGMQKTTGDGYIVAGYSGSNDGDVSGNKGGSDFWVVKLGPELFPPAADFTATPTSGTAPLTVLFNDTSSNTPTSWNWAFGDGCTSTVQNVTHTYTSPGTYTVSLNATNADGSDTKTRSNYIAVATNPPGGGVGSDTSGGGPGGGPGGPGAGGQQQGQGQQQGPGQGQQQGPGPGQQQVFAASQEKTETISVNTEGLSVTTTAAGQQELVIDVSAAEKAGSAVSVRGETIVISQPQLDIIVQAQGIGFGPEGTITGTIQSVGIATAPVTADIGIGQVSTSIDAPVSSIPIGASVTTTISDKVSSDTQSAFQAAAAQSNLQVQAVAYTMAVSKTNLDTTGPATITMTSPAAWVNQHGGPTAIQIGRIGDDRVTEILSTSFRGTDSAGNNIFEGLSPRGLSIFGMISAKASQIKQEQQGVNVSAIPQGTPVTPFTVIVGMVTWVVGIFTGNIFFMGIGATMLCVVSYVVWKRKRGYDWFFRR